MAANTRRRPRENTRSTNSWRGFIRCELTKTQKEECRLFLADVSADAIFEWWISAADTFKISVSHDMDHECYIASMTGSKHSEPMYNGWTLTARGNAVELALGVLMYKHTEVLDGNWEHENDGWPEEGDKIG